MDEFEKVYAALNTAQKEAVDAIGGPVLVVAGPGTGKTQLLSARVAQILRVTDAQPQNILCLTFTESGATNMRERLQRFIGAAAYDVQISTYHSFGGELIRRYPEYFTETRLERPVDELGKRQILATIVEKLPYTSPLKQTRHHLGDLVSTISEIKRGLLTPKGLRAIADANLLDISITSKYIASTLAPFAARMPSKIAVAGPLFASIHNELERANAGTETAATFQSLASLAAMQLQVALGEAEEANSTKPLTAWKNAWLAKDANNQFILAGGLSSLRIRELASVLEAYKAALEKRGLYDFDDMILRAITALEKNLDLKYTLQEQYQYVLLDEFQDTNAAQLRLSHLLSDNPVHEGRPNVLAVGDDDQAIYAFQGAQYSNMLDFASLYRDVTLINLTENYRSTAPILAAARNVAGQITDSLTTALPKLNKQLISKALTGTATQLQHIEYTSDVAERAGVATAIAALVREGVDPSDIAVLAPKHKYLEALVPYIQDRDVAVSYERRENILEAPAIRQLLTMSRLLTALHIRDQATADSLWPEVLSYDFWGYSVADIWKLSWQASDEHEPWAKLLLANAAFRQCALLFLALASQVPGEPLETMLDRLIGTEEVTTGDATDPTVRSPFRLYYAGPEAKPDALYRVVTELSVLRARLREHEQQRGEQLTLLDLLGFANEYRDAEQQLLNTSPYTQSADAVRLMTVFKAKGLEFAHVFILHAQDNVWGEAASNNANKLTLPANLAPLRHAGASEDERLRMFFVAITRAKQGLHLSSHRTNYSGKQIARMKYLLEVEQPDGGSIHSLVLPAPYNIVAFDDKQAPPLSALEHDWSQRHITLDVSLRDLLQDRLTNYQLSPTHLTSFLDLEHAGPQAFLLQTVLKFPSAPGLDASFGNAIHATLEWVQQQVNSGSGTPELKAIQSRFSDFLTRQHLYGEQFALQEARGHEALRGFMKSSEAKFTAGNRSEHSFKHEGVLVSAIVHMAGKIDLLEIDEAAKGITIVDYKTGSLGSNPAKLHRYELQLYCYKLLVEGSHSFRGYRVDTGKLVFVEPDMDGKVITKVFQFKDSELERIQKLLSVMWKHVHMVAMPDISSYSSTLAGMRQFEQDLLVENI